MVQTEIHEKEAFKNDKLELIYFAETIKHLIISCNKPEVFSINASWGMGKTFFIDNLKLLLEENTDAICIKYNAWESDYFNDPFIPLLNEMIIQLNTLFEEDLKANDGISKELEQDIKVSKGFIEKLKRLDYSFSLGFSLGITGNLSIKKDKSEDIFAKYQDYMGNLRSFKEALSLYQKEICKPIVIFIDELDRCRPEYAIKTLEIVKHFFVDNNDSVENANIKFVIAIDRDQIINLVKTMYGCYDKEYNIDGYLRKFFDIDIYMPEPSLELYSKYLFDKYRYQELCINTNSYLQNILFFTEQHNFHKFVNELCKPLNLSLRDLERIYFKFDKVIRLIDRTYDLIIFDLIFLLVVFRHHCFDLYEVLIKKPFSTDSKALYQLYFSKMDLLAPQIRDLFDTVKEAYTYLRKSEERSDYLQNNLSRFIFNMANNHSYYSIRNYPDKVEFIESNLSINKKADHEANLRKRYQ